MAHRSPFIQTPPAPITCLSSREITPKLSLFLWLLKILWQKILLLDLKVEPLILIIAINHLGWGIKKKLSYISWARLKDMAFKYIILWDVIHCLVDWILYMLAKSLFGRDFGKHPLYTHVKHYSLLNILIRWAVKYDPSFSNQPTTILSVCLSCHCNWLQNYKTLTLIKKKKGVRTP